MTSPQTILVRILEAAYTHSRSIDVHDALLLLLRERTIEARSALVAALKAGEGANTFRAFGLEHALRVIASSGTDELLTGATETDRERWDSLLSQMEGYGP